jgi:hypothetical protein
VSTEKQVDKNKQRQIRKARKEITENKNMTNDEKFKALGDLLRETLATTTKEKDKQK